jgi:hypothetical protein
MSVKQMSDGSYVDLSEPDNIDFDIELMAYSLARTYRYGAQAKRDYSVAQHSMYVASICEPLGYGLEGLLHDGSEGWLGDMGSPLKAMMTQYRALEARYEVAIARQHDLRHNGHTHAIVKVADLIALEMERREFMPPIGAGAHHWPGVLMPFNPPKIGRVLGPKAAERKFLNYYYALKEQR